MSKTEEIKALENGAGVQHLLDAAYRILQNPITMFDTTYVLKAYTDVVTDDPIWNELISTGTFSIKTQEFFANEYFTEDVANADKPVILKSDKLKYDRITGFVYNRDGIYVANIVMVFCKTPFNENDAAAFEILVNKITNEIRNDEYYTAYGKAYYEKIIHNLLNRVININDPKIYAAQVQILYNGFEDYLYAAVVDITHNNTHNTDAHENKPGYFKSLLENKYPSFKFAVYSDHIVILMSSKYNTLYEEQLFSKLDNPFSQNNLFVGVSSSFENIYELRENYDKAAAVLKNGIEKNTDQRAFFV